MLIVSKYLVPKGYAGLTVYPFVFVKRKDLKLSATFINHENIHLKQQLEMLILPFFIWYFLEFLLRYVQYKNWSLAYENISFEREAYYHQHKLDYLKHRKPWAFLKYARK